MKKNPSNGAVGKSNKLSVESQSQVTNAKHVTAKSFAQEICRLAWDAEVIWACWLKDRIGISCYPPDKYRDRRVLNILKRTFSRVQKHEDVLWQKLWENTQEEN